MFRDYNSVGDDCDNLLQLVGGKCMNLIKLMKRGVNVPPFFFIDTSVFDKFLSSDLAEGKTLKDYIIKHIKIISQTEDFGVIKSECESIREKMTGLYSDGSNELKETLLEKSGDVLDSKKYYSVRSSGVAEDLPGFSFAGQMDTYLNIKGVENVVLHIYRCFASLFSDRAVMYRKANNFNKIEQLKICVVVQEMVTSVHSSGIAFSANPLTQNRDTVLINCSYGLGEALVSGMVNPDEYEVEKNTFKIIKKDISKKEIKIIYSEKNSLCEHTETVQVEDELKEKQTIGDDLIILLAKEMEKIEDFYKFPQDVEFAFDDKKNLFILQSRAITNLLPLPKMLFKNIKEKKQNQKRVLLSVNRIQVISEAFTPIGAEVITSLLGELLSFRVFQTNEFPNGKYRAFMQGGSALLDLSDFFGHPVIGKIFKKIGVVMDHLMPHIIEILEERKFFNRKDVPKMSFKSSVRITFGFLNLLKTVVSTALFKRLNYLDTHFHSGMEELAKKRRKVLSEEKDLSKKVLLACEILSWDVRMFPTFFPYVVCSVGSFKVLEKMVNDDTLMREVSSGMTLNSKMMEVGMEKLAFIAHQNEKLLEKIKEILEKKKKGCITPEIIMYELSEYEEFLICYKKFLDEFGFRGLSEIEISKKRFLEDSRFLLHFIATHTKENFIDPEKKLKEEIETGKQSIEKIVKKVKNDGKWKWWNILTLGIANFVKVKIAKRLARAYRAFFKYREDPKHYIMKTAFDGKKVLLEIGQVLVERKIFENVDDIFLLSSLEVSEILKKENSEIDIPKIKEKLQKRKKEIEEYPNFSRPVLMLSNGENLEIPAHKKLTKDLPENVLLGNGVAPGIVEGKVKLVLDPQKESLEKGEILVSTQIDPTFSALFSSCAGIISSVGGMMTHGSVVAREIGIPCIVSVNNVTKILKNGMQIKMDGTKGTIEMIKEKKEEGEILEVIE